MLSDVSTQFGVINALRTGNIVLDMIVCMAIPMVFQFFNLIWLHFGGAVMAFINGLSYDHTTVVKTIEHKVNLFHIDDTMS